MRNVYFTAGPSQTYSTVYAHVAIAAEKDIMSISHRGKEFKEIYDGLTVSLRTFLHIPLEYRIFFFSSATEIWERLIENCVEKSSFHFDNGSFGHKFFTTAEMLKKTPSRVEAPAGEAFNYKSVKIPDEAELIGFTHNESSTGVMLDLKDIYAVGKRYPDKLIAIDTVSSIPYPDIDYAKTDAVYFSVQKGFGLPAGLAVLILSPRAYEKSLVLQKKGLSIGSYHSFPELEEYAKKSQTPETPNVLTMYLFWQVLLDYLLVGAENMRKDTEKKAKLLYAYFDKHPKYKPAVKDKKNRSKTLIVIETGKDTAKVMKTLDDDGLIVGSGYGDKKDSQIRIANFPAHTLDDMKRLIDVIEKH